jgi:hypothetical protein
MGDSSVWGNCHGVAGYPEVWRCDGYNESNGVSGDTPTGGPTVQPHFDSGDSGACSFPPNQPVWVPIDDAALQESIWCCQY